MHYILLLSTFFCYLAAPNIFAGQMQTQNFSLHEELIKIIPRASLIPIDFASVCYALETVLLLQQPKAFDSRALGPLFLNSFIIRKDASNKMIYLCRHPDFPKLFRLLHDYAKNNFSHEDYEHALLETSHTASPITSHLEIIAEILKVYPFPIVFSCQGTYSETVYEDTGQRSNYPAAIQRFEKIIVLLLKQNADINECDNNGCSGLNTLNFLNEYTIAFMLNANANPDVASKHSKTTLYTKMPDVDTIRKRHFPERVIVPLAEQPRIKQALAAYYERLEAYKKEWFSHVGQPLENIYIPSDLAKIIRSYCDDAWNMPAIIPPIDAIEDIQYDSNTTTSHG